MTAAPVVPTFQNQTTVTARHDASLPRVAKDGLGLRCR
jgi:hypothetical protein